MIPELETLIEKYLPKGVFVDSNLLLLWFIGALDKSLIPRFKRINHFGSDDFEILDRLLAKFFRRVTTPNVLTELSNLCGNMGKRATDFYTRVFCALVSGMEERYVPSKSVLGDEALPRFGLTDCGIVALAKGEYLLLSDDWPLTQFFISIGGDAVNFNHIRSMMWGI